MKDRDKERERGIESDQDLLQWVRVSKSIQILPLRIRCNNRDWVTEKT